MPTGVYVRKLIIKENIGLIILQVHYMCYN